MSITRELQNLGIAMPKAMAEAEALRERVLGTGVYVVENPEVAEVCAQIRARSIKPGDVSARMLAAGTLVAARQAVRSLADEYTRALDQCDARALLESSDELYGLLRPLVVDHGKLLADSVQVVGVDPDSKTIGRMGSGVGASWGQFGESVAVLQMVSTVVAAIAAVHGAVRHVSPVTWIDLGQVNTAVDVERVTSTFGRFPVMVGAGFRLTLNTAAEVSAKLSAIAAGTSAAVAAQRQEAVDDAGEYGGKYREAMIEGKVLPRR